MADDDLTMALQRPTHNLIILRRDGKWTQETVWKPDRFYKIPGDLPRRRFAFSCRYLCGQDLKRPHLTCLATLLGMGCRMRLSWKKKIPSIIDLEGLSTIQFMPRKNRRFAKQKTRLMYYAVKYFTTIVQNLLCN